MTHAGRSRALHLAVLGGSSPGIPALLSALAESQRHGRLMEIEVRLHGRNEQRLARIRRFAELQMERPLAIEVSTQLDEVLAGATHVLCMLRPGGMAGRAQDEALALRAGTPADEGLGIGGLACFLRGRELIAQVAARCSELAPEALFLQMTSPLGLNVALSRRSLSEQAIGVCELPIVTAARISSELHGRGFIGEIRARCFGLNHQSWLYGFQTEDGADVTDRVLAILDTDKLIGIDATLVRRLGAIPMRYMRLYFHTDRVLDEQQDQRRCRGEALLEWSRRLDDAYCGGSEPDVQAISRLLAERRMDWFEKAVVPVIEASTSADTRRMPLSVAAGGLAEGVKPHAIVEMDCEVSASGVRGLPALPLPPVPQEITRRLLMFEEAALALAERLRPADVAEVLALHPLRPAANLTAVARALASLPPAA
jgi:6-phospho-beta-glucosidase